MSLATSVKKRCKLLHLSQSDLAAKAGVGLCFLRELEQSKPTLLDKVNEVLRLFGHELATAPNLPITTMCSDEVQLHGQLESYLLQNEESFTLTLIELYHGNIQYFYTTLTRQHHDKYADSRLFFMLRGSELKL